MCCETPIRKILLSISGVGDTGVHYQVGSPEEMGSEETTLKINKGIGKERLEEMALMPSAG